MQMELVKHPIKTEPDLTRSVTAYDLPHSKDSLMASSELGGGLMSCFLLELITVYKNTQITKMMLLWEIQDD